MSREIIVSPRKPGERPQLGQGPVTVLAHGDIGTGKTRWAATSPRPVIFAEDTESGWETIQSMDPSLWWEPSVAPLVWTIQTLEDIPALVARARPLIAAGKIQTIVGDSVTFMADLFQAAIVRQMGGDPMKVDNRRVFGRLGERLRELRISVHGLGVNVIWTALSTKPDEEHPQVVPMIQGAQGVKFGAGCNYVLYFQQSFTARGIEQPRNHYDIHTRSFGRAMARSRDSGWLPSPMPNTTYRDFLTVLQNSTPKVVGGQVTDPTGSVSPATSAGPKPVGRPVFAAPKK